MNKKQRWVLFVCAAIIALMLLFPPVYFHAAEGGADANRGFGFLFDSRNDQIFVNAGTLLLQWVGTILVAGILWFALRDKG